MLSFWVLLARPRALFWEALGWRLLGRYALSISVNLRRSWTEDEPKTLGLPSMINTRALWEAS